MVLNLELFEIIKSEKELVVREFKKDDILFREGDDPSGIYCIDSGNIKLIKNESKANNRIVHLASKGEILGVHAILNTHPHTNTAAVMDKSRVSFLGAHRFCELLETDNSYKLLVMKALCTRIDTMEHHINLISEKQTEQRFADTVLMLMRKYGLKQKHKLKINLPLEDLANYTCTSRTYMRKIIIDFSQKGIISYRNGEINILIESTFESIALRRRI
jgi:CRP/FNR family transcriptional regulator